MQKWIPWPWKPMKRHITCLKSAVLQSYCNLRYSTVLYSTVRYQNGNFKLRNGFLDLKNHRKDIYHDYNVLSLEKNWFLMYSTVQYSTVQYSKINFEFKNGFPDPKNPQNDISHVQIWPVEAVINFGHFGKMWPSVRNGENCQKHEDLQPTLWGKLF